MPNIPQTSASSLPETPDVIRGKRVIVSGEERPAAIHIRDGLMVRISAFNEIPNDCRVYEADNLVVMPGVVDPHVHINEPGRTEWEGFETATRAAAAGGVTTIIEMPLNSIPAVTTVAAYEEKIAAAQGKLSVDVGFWGGVIPNNVHQIVPLWKAGVFGFKCFLVPSGVEEFPSVTEKELLAALPELASVGAVLLAHAEIPEPIERASSALAGASPQRYATWLASRPRASEDKAIELLLRLVRDANVRLHIVHLSSSNSVPQLRRAKLQGIGVTVETCPHYLAFSAEEIPDGATEYKCAPPIRERENCEKLWAALAEGTIDFIATDHSPCPPSLKLAEQGDFLRAWGGISSLQLSLPVVWTSARKRGHDITHVAEWLCGRPARLAALEKRKGNIAVGCDADIVVWDPDARFRVEPARLYHRHKLTPYVGRELMGQVKTTFLRGRRIFDQGEFSSQPEGRILRRGQA